MFASFLQAGFECSTHKLRTGRRLDITAATRHDQFVTRDYRRLVELGIRTVREGLRWHLIEPSAGSRDFRTTLPFIIEADKQGIEIIWDLLHFGWPDHEDVFDKQWPARFSDLAVAFVRFLKQHSSSPAWIAPVNEISFLSWAGGEAGNLNPFARGRGLEFKHQLVRGGILAARAIRRETANVRFLWPDPVIHIAGRAPETEEYRVAMFEAWDMLSGRQHQELGGDSNLVDVIGVNFYERNQWREDGKTLFRGEAGYRSFREIIAEVYDRYRKPIVVSETGTEGAGRVAWFAYICSEVEASIASGIPVQGVCWYPILNHPGWDDDRHCQNGVWDYPNLRGDRDAYEPLAHEFKKTQVRRGTINPMTGNTLPAWPKDLVCLSHLRWEGVFQRPQHLMSRFAKCLRVFFIEEPILDEGAARLECRKCEQSTVTVVTPHLPKTTRDTTESISKLLEDFFAVHSVTSPYAWFYTPMALDWLPKSCQPAVIAYDCMDELSLFRGASPQLTKNEALLFSRAGVVFTGGITLYEAKREKHPNVHAFPSAVDVKHFAKARGLSDTQPDQKMLPHPRIGFAGVVDERMDLELLRKLAALRPNYQFVLLGPVVKIDADALPKSDNIHWLGLKKYHDLPSYMAGWDVAFMPFALNESTRYISPTKTPEYLAAGLPVISTRIRDVVNPYENLGLVQIADNAEEFAGTLDSLLETGPLAEWRSHAKSYVQDLSWDATWQQMASLLERSLPVPTQAILEESEAIYV